MQIPRKYHAIYAGIPQRIYGGKFPYIQKYFFVYAEIYFRIYGNLAAHIRALPRALWEKGLTSPARNQPFNSKPTSESGKAYERTSTWGVLLLARRITLADPVKAHSREVDIEARVIILFADDPDRPIGEDHQFAIDRLATADLTRIRPGLTLVFAEEDLQVVARGAGGESVQ